MRQTLNTMARYGIIKRHIKNCKINRIKKMTTIAKISFLIASAGFIGGVRLADKLGAFDEKTKGASIVEAQTQIPPVIKTVKRLEINFSREEYYKKINEAKKREAEALKAKAQAQKKAVAKPQSVQPKMATKNISDWKKINASCSAPIGQARTNIQNYINERAKAYNISAKFLGEMLRRESNWRWCAVGDFHISQPSVGIAQINLRWHPNISKNQALDWKFSVNWTASEIAKGKASMWTTGRKMIKEGWVWR